MAQGRDGYSPDVAFAARLVAPSISPPAADVASPATPVAPAATEVISATADETALAAIWMRAARRQTASELAGSERQVKRDERLMRGWRASRVRPSGGAIESRVHVYGPTKRERIRSCESAEIERRNASIMIRIWTIEGLTGGYQGSSEVARRAFKKNETTVSLNPAGTRSHSPCLAPSARAAGMTCSCGCGWGSAIATAERIARRVTLESFILGSGLCFVRLEFKVSKGLYGWIYEIYEIYEIESRLYLFQWRLFREWREM